MSYVLIVVAVILCLLFKLLNVNNSPERSLFYCKNAALLDHVLKHAPMLAEPYTPPRLWGYSGHIQTIIQSAISLLHCPLVNGRRFFLRAKDGATVSYDLYHPIEKLSSNDDVTLVICPGICNSSESVYIRRTTYQAQLTGFRVAVLNHIGALKKLQITSPRIFNYGNTGDYHLMVVDILKRFPNTKIVCVGFSMGANLVTKYLGETERSEQIMAGISVCQGYDAKETTKYLLGWEGFRRFYFFIMTENMRTILRTYQKQLFTEEVKQKYEINERAIWSAASLVELDEAYTRRISGFATMEEFYKKSSCVSVWDKIKVPMVFVNAKDDPIVPPPLLRHVRNAAGQKDNFLFIEQKYGGHLGFYEGGFIYPNPLTWMDRLVSQISNALLLYATDEKMLNLEKFSDEEFSDQENSLSDGEIFQSSVVKPSRPALLCRRRTISGPQQGHVKKM